MMNPFSDVCKKSLTVSHLPTKRCQADSCYLVFQVDNISSDHSILFHFGHVYIQVYWNGCHAFILMSFESKYQQCMCHAFQHSINEYLHVERLYMFLASNVF